MGTYRRASDWRHPQADCCTLILCLEMAINSGADALAFIFVLK